MKRSIHAFFLALTLIGAAVALLAPSAEASAIVDTGYVVDALKRNAILWDTRSAADYKQGGGVSNVDIDGNNTL